MWTDLTNKVKYKVAWLLTIKKIPIYFWGQFYLQLTEKWRKKDFVQNKSCHCLQNIQWFSFFESGGVHGKMLL